MTKHVHGASQAQQPAAKAAKSAAEPKKDVKPAEPKKESKPAAPKKDTK